MLCGDCENIDVTLSLIKDKADEKVTWENKEAIMYTVRSLLHLGFFACEIAVYIFNYSNIIFLRCPLVSC